MLDRKMLIKELTRYEVQWLLDQDDQKLVDEVAEFFSKGGYFNWSLEDLLNKYKLQIAEDIQNA